MTTGGPPRQGDLEFPTMSSEARQDLSEVLIDYADGFNELLRLLFEKGPGAADSRASRYQAEERSDLKSHGSQPTRVATRSLLFSAIAGLDHLRTFAVALASEYSAFALATISRGAVEAYARSYWLMVAPNQTEFLTRWLSGISKEFSVRLSFDPHGELLSSSGGKVSVAMLLQHVLDDLERLNGSRKPLPISYTTLAMRLVSRFNPDARAVYSQLSGVAHGESLGIHAFVGADAGEEIFVVALPDHWGLSYVEQVFTATSITLRELLNFMGWAEDPTDPWGVAHDKAQDRIKEHHRRVFREEPGLIVPE